MLLKYNIIKRNYIKMDTCPCGKEISDLEIMCHSKCVCNKIIPSANPLCHSLCSCGDIMKVDAIIYKNIDYDGEYVERTDRITTYICKCGRFSIYAKTAL